MTFSRHCSGAGAARCLLAWGLLLTSLSAAGAQAPAPPAALTLSDAVTRALARQPSVTAAMQRVRQAEFHLRGSLALPSTLLDIGHGQTLTQPGASGNDQDILLTQHLELFGQRRLRGNQARRELEAAEAGLAQARTEATFRVRTAYAAARAAASEEQLAREAVTVAETFRRLADAQYKAGEVPIASVLRSEIEVENAEQALLTAETNARIQRAALNAAMAEGLETPVVLPALSEVTLHTFDVEELRHLSRAQPAVRAAEATLAARHGAIAVARSAGRPDFVIEGAHDQLQDWPGGNVIRLGLNFPIWDHGATRAAVGEARAAAAEQEANLAVLRLQSELDVTTAYYTLEQSRLLVQRTGGAQVQRATRLYELSRLSFSEGLTNYLDLLDAQQVLRSTLSAYLRALAAYEAAEAGLERSLGTPLPEPKSSTPARYAPPVLPALPNVPGAPTKE